MIINMSSEIRGTNFWFEEINTPSEKKNITPLFSTWHFWILEWRISAPKKIVMVFFTAKYSWFDWYEIIFPYIIYTKKYANYFFVFFMLEMGSHDYYTVEKTYSLFDLFLSTLIYFVFGSLSWPRSRTLSYFLTHLASSTCKPLPCQVSLSSRTETFCLWLSGDGIWTTNCFCLPIVANEIFTMPQEDRSMKEFVYWKFSWDRFFLWERVVIGF